MDDPVVAGTGSSELHRQTLCDYNIFGHFYFFYQQFEMRGWDIIPAEDRVDSPLANLAQIPVNGYKDSLTFNYPSAFYGVPIHWPYVSSR